MNRHLHRVWTALVAALALVLGMVMMTAAPASAVTSIGNTASPTRWRPAGGTNGAVVYAMARMGDKVILGGSFTSMVSSTGQTVPRANLAALNASTGDLLSWAPNPNGEVRALEVSPDDATVYVGGSFTSIGSADRTNLAAIRADSGLARPGFTAGHFNAGVRDLLYLDGRLFVGGTFWKIDTSNRGGGAELDPATGALRSWNPATNWGIYAMTPAPDHSGMFVGGPFSTISGQAQEFLAEVTLDKGALLPWKEHQTCIDPDPVPERCTVFGMVTDSDSLFVAAGGPGGRVTAFDPSTGSEQWRVQADGDFQTIALDGDMIIAGGHFDQAVEGLSRAGLVAVHKDTGQVLPQPSVPIIGSSGVWSLLVDARVLRVGGIFTTVDGKALPKYTTFDITRSTPGGPPAPIPDPIPAPNPAPNPAPIPAPNPVPIHVTVAASRAGYGNVLHVDMWPNRGGASYLFRVQRQGNGRWATLTASYRTEGTGETRSITLPKSTYRVYLPASGGYAAAVSKAVTLTDPTVMVSTTTNALRSKLKVNVNPNEGSGYWTFRVQRRTSAGTWSTLRTTYKTRGKAETRTVNLRRGMYRVVIAPKYGFRGTTSAAVTLVR